MKHYVSLVGLFMLTIFSTNQVLCQSTIKFDPGNKALLQFDQSFILQVDSVKMGTIQKVYVYEVKYKNGVAQLTDRTFTRTVRPSFSLSGSPGFTLNGTSLKINFPALRPDRDFDVMIEASFSKDHLKQALQINKDLYAHKVEQDVIVAADPALNAEFMVLYNAVNQVPANYPSPIYVFNYNLIDYRKAVYLPLEPAYDQLMVNNSMFKIPTAAVDEREINFLYSHVGQPILLQYQVAALARIKVADTTLVKVFKGIIPATYHLPALNADPFDLDKRMANLNSSLRYIDSLNGCVELIRNIDATEYKKLKTEFKEWFDDLNANVVFLKKINDQINKAVLSLGKESMWLAQGTRSGDLKTTGSRHVTVDVGMTDIMAFDNSNKYKSIPKLFFGLNYYFRSIDKNADWNKIPDPGAPDKNTAHYLESRYSVLQRLSLTGGFTLGAMQNKDFDNVYNGLSFTLGPSYRIGKIFKISVGAAFLKRYDNEPIRTHSSIVLGDYVSLSLDYDLLTAASNITGMLFK